MTIWVLNTGAEQLTVPIALEGNSDKAVDSVFIQSKSKAKLPEGYVVESNFLARNPAIKTKTANTTAPTQPAQVQQNNQQQQDRDSRKTQFKKSENAQF